MGKKLKMIATATRRVHKFDGVNNIGLSKLMVDIFALPVKQMIEKEKELSMVDGYAKMKLIVNEVALELDLPIESIKGKDRKIHNIMARSIICFITRYTTKLSLNEIGKEISIYLPKDHSSVIHATQKAFDFIHNPDHEFTVVFKRVRQRLEAHYGITFDLKDYEQMPQWYKRMLNQMNGK